MYDTNLGRHAAQGLGAVRLVNEQPWNLGTIRLYSLTSNGSTGLYAKCDETPGQMPCASTGVAGQKLKEQCTHKWVLTGHKFLSNTFMHLPGFRRRQERTTSL